MQQLQHFSSSNNTSAAATTKAPVISSEIAGQKSTSDLFGDRRAKKHQ
uniref:Uncharacterized protein n=1 Tax=Meloidogyne enterolobii TaxID=390850 RepID=A0A6V7TJD3_MELEN|nr:unnamed protein product [Meloidogyne enterolobii]